MQDLNSVITGALKAVSDPENWTGPSLGREISAASRSAVLAKLLANTPEETDKALLTWLKSQDVGVTPEVRLTYPATGGYRRELTGFTFSNLKPEVRDTARGHVMSAMARPEIDDCEAWVTTMHAVMAHRGSSQTALELILTIYAGCLRGYPADVGKTVCQELAIRREKPNWFPTLSELDEACEKRTEQRKALLASLGR
jgi:hypothetical protein